MTSLSPYCIMMGTMMQCRHLCPGRARVPSACEPPQQAGGQRRRRGLGAERRSSATKRLGCTPQLTHQTFIFPAGRWRTPDERSAQGRIPDSRLHVAVSIGKISLCPLHPCFPAPIMRLLANFFQRERERDCLQMTARTGARSRVVCALVHGSHDRNWKKCSGTNGDVLSAASNPSLSWV
jgi:hypothetical protein